MFIIDLLIKQIQKGNKQAFSELIHPLIPRAYKTAFGILQSQPCAEDAVQKAMIEAYTNIMAEKKIKNFPAWFNRLVACRSLDIIRQRAKQLTMTTALNPDEITDRQTTIDHLLDNEMKGEINEAVLSLENVNYRAVIILYYFQEMSVSEIADVMDVKEGTVKTHLRRARQALEQKLRYKKELGVI